MPVHETLHRLGDVSRPAVSIDSVAHPAARRAVDVLRSRATTPRTLLLDDAESIEHAIEAGVAIEAVYAEPRHDEAAARLQRRCVGAERFVVPGEVMRVLSPADSRSRVVAIARAPRPARWGDVVSRDGDVVVLDGVRITGNIGAIVRSARALGAAGVLLVDSGLGSAFDRRLIRASRGLVFALPTVVVGRERLLSLLEAERMPLVGLAAGAQRPLSRIRQYPGRVALVMGSERFGVSSMLDAVASERYAVPMEAGVDSLNVSVAAALALYERRRL